MEGLFKASSVPPYLSMDGYRDAWFIGDRYLAKVEGRLRGIVDCLVGESPHTERVFGRDLSLRGYYIFLR